MAPPRFVCSRSPIYLFEKAGVQMEERKILWF